MPPTGVRTGTVKPSALAAPAPYPDTPHPQRYRVFCDAHRRQTMPGHRFRPFTRFNPFWRRLPRGGQWSASTPSPYRNVSVKTAGVYQDYFAGSGGVHLDIIVSHRDASTPRSAGIFPAAVNGFAGAQKAFARWQMPARVALPSDAGSAPGDGKCACAMQQIIRQGFVENDGRLHATLRKSWQARHAPTGTGFLLLTRLAIIDQPLPRCRQRRVVVNDE